ncbi:unnamed protein product [Prorocentrum cordatum]|uniref:Uncharacterized protein n=1 Tax=Prorocentrum cordatum TaxID=2364126 RepID=A0ABN9Y6D8_9DINO|nr:unnamed protein product [Polarella glacialis]
MSMTMRPVGNEESNAERVTLPRPGEGPRRPTTAILTDIRAVGWPGWHFGGQRLCLHGAAQISWGARRRAGAAHRASAQPPLPALPDLSCAWRRWSLLIRRPGSERS